jgi:hypothetical protein
MRKLFFALLFIIASPAFAATCYVTEVPFTSIYYQAVPLPPVASQHITVSGTSAQSAAFNKLTYIIRINCDVIVSLVVGTNPTATTNDLRIPANQTEYFVVQPADKIAFVTNN